MTLPASKACAKCGAVKARADFNVKRSEKSGLRTRCRDCERVDRRITYLADPQKAIAKTKAYAKRHPDKVAALAKKTYLRSHESRKARNRDYYARNKEKAADAHRDRYAVKAEIICERVRKYRAANKEKISALNKAWRASNKDRCASNANAARARKRNAEGSHSRSEWSARLDEFNERCAYCLQPAKLTRDHMTPLSRGGSDSIENIVPACKSCNSSKNAKTILEFARFCV